MSIKKMDISQIQYTPTEGEIIQDTVSGKYAMWHENAWQFIQMEGGGIELGIYDMNKQIITQLPALTNLDEKAQLINELDNQWRNKYYMLYGKEISYFTLFVMKERCVFGHEVIECLKNVGVIKAIDLTEENDAIEAWVDNEGEATCLYLFPYDNGIVQVGE